MPSSLQVKYGAGSRIQQAKGTTISGSAGVHFPQTARSGGCGMCRGTSILSADNIIIEVGYLREQYIAKYTSIGDAPVD